MTREEILVALRDERDRLSAAIVTLSEGPSVYTATRSASAPAKPRKLTATEALVLSVVKDGHATTAAIAKEAKLHVITARKILHALIVAGKVEATGATTNRRYVVA